MYKTILELDYPRNLDLDACCIMYLLVSLFNH